MMVQTREMIVKKIKEYIGRTLVILWMVRLGIMCIPSIIQNEQSLADSHIEPRPAFYILPIGVFFVWLATKEYKHKRYFVTIILILMGLWSLYVWWQIRSITCSGCRGC